jgi:hypothetical protein
MVRSDRRVGLRRAELDILRTVLPEHPQESSFWPMTFGSSRAVVESWASDTYC